MKTKIIALLSLSALTFSPLFGAPAKMKSTGKSARVAPADPATAAKVSSRQAGARELVAKLTTAQKSRMLALLNEGSAEELTAIKGVSTVRVAAIEKARPFETIDEVILVSGVGKGTFAEIVTHARGLTTKRKSPSASSRKKVKKS